MKQASKLTLWPGENPTRFNVEDFNDFLAWAHEIGASDILIEAGSRLGIKIYGACKDVSKRVIRLEELTFILAEIFQAAAPNLLRSGQPLDFAHTIMLKDQSIIRFRVNATSARGAGGADVGIAMVLRTIPSAPPSCAEIGVENQIIQTSENNKYGLILITGPTGSGKSTLIGAIFRGIIEKQEKHILTYEAPIEFDMKAVANGKARVSQSEVPTHVPNFDAAVSNALRRAPDIILIGESRDKETIAGCVRASQTGHLVFSTVHTNNVAMTIARMVDEFPPEERKGATAKLVDAIRMIVHQRLVPGKHGGRVALKEFLVFTEDHRRYLQSKLLTKDDIGADIQHLLETDSQNGQSLINDARKKMIRGKISLDTFTVLANELGTDHDIELINKMRENYVAGKTDAERARSAITEG